jgi:hypothetical protein
MDLDVSSCAPCFFLLFSASSRNGFSLYTFSLSITYTMESLDLAIGGKPRIRLNYITKNVAWRIISEASMRRSSDNNEMEGKEASEAVM